RELWTGLAADDYRRATARLAALAGETSQLQQQLAAADAELANLEQRLGEVDSHATDQEKDLRRIERRRSSGREEIARSESTIRHHATGQAELAAEIERLRRQRHVLRLQAQAIDGELDESTIRLQQFQQDFD